MKLSEFDIQYRPRPALKAQILADFIAECPTTDQMSEDRSSKEAATCEYNPGSTWVLHIDGASNAQGSGAGFLLTNSEGVVTKYALRFNFKASNNQAEYEVLLAGLRVVKELEIDSLRIFSDSQQIVGQVRGEFKARDPTMVKYFRR